MRGLKGASLWRSASMRSASAARELLGRALLSLNCLRTAEDLLTLSDMQSSLLTVSHRDHLQRLRCLGERQTSFLGVASPVKVCG